MTNKLNRIAILPRQTGFTLIELMIVVAIIGILTAIAIPNFLRYQLLSKTTEAKNNLSAISKSEVAYKAEWDGYVSIAATPPNASPNKVAWIPAIPLSPGRGGGLGSFGDLSFIPLGNVYYTYAVAIGPSINGIPNQEATSDGTSDLDGDGNLGLFATALANRIPVLPGAQSGGLVPTSTVSIENLAQGNF